MNFAVNNTRQIIYIILIVSSVLYVAGVSIACFICKRRRNQNRNGKVSHNKKKKYTADLGEDSVDEEHHVEEKPKEEGVMEEKAVGSEVGRSVDFFKQHRQVPLAFLSEQQHSVQPTAQESITVPRIDSNIPPMSGAMCLPVYVTEWVQSPQAADDQVQLTEKAQQTKAEEEVNQTQAARVLPVQLLTPLSNLLQAESKRQSITIPLVDQCKPVEVPPEDPIDLNKSATKKKRFSFSQEIPTKASIPTTQTNQETEEEIISVHLYEHDVQQCPSDESDIPVPKTIGIKSISEASSVPTPQEIRTRSHDVGESLHFESSDTKLTAIPTTGDCNLARYILPADSSSDRSSCSENSSSSASTETSHMFHCGTAGQTTLSDSRGLGRSTPDNSDENFQAVGNRMPSGVQRAALLAARLRDALVANENPPTMNCTKMAQCSRTSENRDEIGENASVFATTLDKGKNESSLPTEGRLAKRLREVLANRGGATSSLHCQVGQDTSSSSTSEDTSNTTKQTQSSEISDNNVILTGMAKLRKGQIPYVDKIACGSERGIHDIHGTTCSHATSGVSNRHSGSTDSSSTLAEKVKGRLVDFCGTGGSHDGACHMKHNFKTYNGVDGFCTTDESESRDQSSREMRDRRVSRDHDIFREVRKQIHLNTALFPQDPFEIRQFPSKPEVMSRGSSFQPQQGLARSDSPRVDGNVVKERKVRSALDGGAVCGTIVEGTTSSRSIPKTPIQSGRYGKKRIQTE